MSNRTTNFNLLKPAQEDFYNVDDFNANADIIDAALRTLTQRVDTLLQDPISTGTYLGNGANGRMISLGFTPRAVVLTNAVTVGTGATTSIAVTGSSGFGQGITITANGFTVMASYNHINGYRYNYVAFR